MYSLHTSVAVSSPSSSHASSRMGSSQCHGQRLLCCFGGMLSGHAHGSAKTLSDIKNYWVAKQRPWQHRSSPAMLQHVCVSISWRAMLAVLPIGSLPSSSSSAGGSQGCQPGHVHQPSAAWRASLSRGRGLCLLSPPSWFSPTVWLCICGQLWGLPKYLWRNLGPTKARTNPGYA